MIGVAALTDGQAAAEMSQQTGRQGCSGGTRVVVRSVQIIAAMLSLVVLGVSVGGFVVVRWFDASVERVHLVHGQNRPAPAPPGTENWLLVGTDSRAGTNGAYGSVAGERSDTTILAHLDADGTTTNLSFPRDTLVTIPAYTDSSGHLQPAHKDKFNAAISLGGPSLLVRTVEQMTGMRIDHYVSVDLEGFKRIADVLDGVEVCILPSSGSPEVTTENGITHVSTNLNDSYSGFHGHVGYQKVSGDQALAFVRQRHGLTGGDIDRIKRQQQFLGSVFRTATKTGFLFNPIAVARLLGAISGALTLDQATSLSDLERLALRLRGTNPGQIRFETIPQRGLQPTDTQLGQVFTDRSGILELIPNGQTASVGSVQVLDQAGFDTMIGDLDRSHMATPTSSPLHAVPLPPSQVLVTVAGTAHEQALISQASIALANDGFRIGPPTTISVIDQAASEVRYTPGSEAAARTVAAAVPGAKLVPDRSISQGVVLVVGSNYRGVIRVATSPATAISPSLARSMGSSASPLPAPETAGSAGNRCSY